VLFKDLVAILVCGYYPRPPSYLCFTRGQVLLQVAMVNLLSSDQEVMSSNPGNSVLLAGVIHPPKIPHGGYLCSGPPFYILCFTNMIICGLFYALCPFFWLLYTSEENS
jgi:hypothetical protein